MASGLQIVEDMRFQRLSWKVQRFGWAAMALFLAAGLAGLFGGGPLSDVQARTGEALRVRYDRFLRRGIPSALTVTFTPRGDVSRISLPTRYLEDAGIDRIRPDPSTVEAAGDRTVFSFRTSGPADRPAVVVFTMESDGMGKLSADMRLENLPPVRLRHVVFP